MLPTTKAGSINADYGQFYVYDAREGPGEGPVDPQRAHLADRESQKRGLGVGSRFIAVYTACQAGAVPVEVETLTARPAPELGPWEHVVEGSIQLPSGRLVIASWDDTGPTIAVDLPPGSYRVRVRGRGLQKTDDSADAVDAYSFQVWKEAAAPPAVLKAWRGYEARVSGMP